MIDRVKTFFNDYKKYPLSLALRLIVIFSIGIFVFTFIALVGFVLIKGVVNLRWDMFSLTYTTENHSMMPAIINTFIMIAMTLFIVLPIGIFSAIYLVEYAKKGSIFVKVIRLTSETLAGIPSIVYGLFGYVVFVYTFNIGYTLLGGVITLSIMVLPLIMRTTEEALIAVPNSFREGSYSLGAGKLRTIFKIVLPSSINGVFAGVILAIGRIVGETAALIFTSGMHSQVVEGVMSSGRTLAVHMYALFNEGHYIDEAYATGVVLLVMVVGINALSYYVSKKLTQNYK